jgi:FixJ family two-component response regulator
MVQQATQLVSHQQAETRSALERIAAFAAAARAKAGAVEFLAKPFSDDVLLSAIRNAIERSKTALGHEAEMQALRDRYESLTRRERKVMALVASGLLNKQVGGELGISEITVKAHRGQVMQKMKADSFAELVKMAARLGLPGVPKGLILQS